LTYTVNEIVPDLRTAPANWHIFRTRSIMNDWTHTTTSSSSPSSTMHANGLTAMGAVLALGIIGGVISTIVTTEQLQCFVAAAQTMALSGRQTDSMHAADPTSPLALIVDDDPASVSPRTLVWKRTGYAWRRWLPARRPLTLPPPVCPTS